MYRPVKTLFLLVLFSFLVSNCTAQNSIVQKAAPVLQFDFGANISKGYTKVNAATAYSEETGFGFENTSLLKEVVRGGGKALSDGFVTSEQPFYFSVKLPEGTYHVKLVVGDGQGTSDVAIRAECRRMMVERATTKKGEIKTVEFTVHIRDTFIRTTGNIVRIKSRERAFLHWDNKLTLEFNGTAPKINALEIKPAGNEVTTIFLAGNSTVVDQAEEPYAAWGQIIPAFFQPRSIAIANYAESGESLSSFISAKRFEKVLSLLKKGDYAFAEFGHNDQKQRGEGIGAFTSYKKDLLYFINEVKKKGGIPVLVTSMQRRHFDSTTGKINETLGDYPEAVRQTAREEKVALIDLNAQSKIMYEAWGPEESKKAFVIYPANTFPGQTRELKDNTHFNPYGAYEIAKCIVTGMRQNELPIVKFLKEMKPFDPAKPDAVTDLYWPLSPSLAATKPDGN